MATKRKNSTLSEDAKLRALKQAIQEGLDSGVSERTMDEVWADAERRYRNHQLD